MSHPILIRFGITDQPDATASGSTWHTGTGPSIAVHSPIDGALLATIASATPADVTRAIDAAHAAFLKLRVIPAPLRGEFVRRIGVKLRERKSDLADLVTLEAGKITSESLGEVQEMIDICDFAVGLSRQLHGLTIASERPGHRMMEQYHPLGVVGVISAFNFPVAVWAWNAMLALVCGDPVIWKPSEKTPLTALATHKIVLDVLNESTDLKIPPDVVGLVIGGAEVGQALAESPQVPLVSATGSIRMGRAVGQVVAGRLGRTILELGGNNAMIVAPLGRRGDGHPRDHLRRVRDRRPALHDAPPPDRPRRGLRPDHPACPGDRRPAQGRRPPDHWDSAWPLDRSGRLRRHAGLPCVRLGKRARP